MQRTEINYLTHTWNPLAMRCTPVSAGCRNCWHLAMAKRLASNSRIPKNLREAYSGEAMKQKIVNIERSPFNNQYFIELACGHSVTRFRLSQRTDVLNCPQCKKSQLTPHASTATDAETNTKGAMRPASGERCPAGVNDASRNSD